MAGAPERQVIVPHAAVIKPVSHVRTTLLGPSVALVRERGLLERYLGALPKEHHETLQHLVMGEWAPLALAVAHYTAMDALGFSPQEQLEIGRAVGSRVQGSFLGTILRLAGSAASPFFALEQMPRIQSRIFQGGSVAVFKVGPRDAVVEFAGVPLVRIAYFRQGLRGLASSGLELVTRRAFAEARYTQADRLELSLSWV